jgi:hypothetical protein
MSAIFNNLKFLIVIGFFSWSFLNIAHSATHEETSLAKLGSQTADELYDSITKSVLHLKAIEKFGHRLPVLNGKLEKSEIIIQALDELSNSTDLQILNRVQKSTLILKTYLTNPADILQTYIIYLQAGGKKIESWELDIQSTSQREIKNGVYNERLAYILISYSEFFKKIGFRIDESLWQQIIQEITKHSDRGFLKNLTLVRSSLLKKNTSTKNDQKILYDLLNVEPEVANYRSGYYLNTPRIYMFCRENRKQKCIMIIKKYDGSVLLNPDGKTYWSHPSLGNSRHEKDFNQANGNTPSGVFRIDGVMTNTDNKFVFGSFRRLVLNFVSKTPDELNYKYLIPTSSHELNWWREAVVARDMGRGLFRIHGTWLPSSRSEPFYPLVPTSGCVAQRENNYDGEKYIDQRLLLDSLMIASNLTPTESNETKIRGLLYVINIDNQERAVELSDLIKLGLFQ